MLKSNMCSIYMYLKDALKDSPSESILQGLTKAAGKYDEAIECLLNQYD